MTPTLVIANAGLPMLVVYGPVLLIALYPIILLETWMIDQRSHLGIRYLHWRVAVANAVSTIVGVPLTWIGLVCVQVLSGGGSDHGAGLSVVVWQSPWLMPNRDHLGWMIPVAGLVLTIPFWLVSVLIEVKVLEILLKNVTLKPGLSIKRLCFIANSWTYTYIVFFWACLLIMGLWST